MHVTTAPKGGTHLAIYTDDQGIMRLLGPRGWQCSATYGMDGSGGVSVFPPGTLAPESQSFIPSTSEAIIGSETSACVGCRYGQACPLFSAAASAELNTFGMPCARARPADEIVKTISPGVSEFTDPPDVAGDGNPSGGPYYAEGVMTYYLPSRTETGSWMDTCTLPVRYRAICGAAIQLFVKSYGRK